MPGKHNAGGCGCCNDNCVSGACQDYTSHEWSALLCDFELETSGDTPDELDNSQFCDDFSGLLLDFGNLAASSTPFNLYYLSGDTPYTYEYSATLTDILPSTSYDMRLYNLVTTSTEDWTIDNVDAFIGATSNGVNCDRRIWLAVACSLSKTGVRTDNLVIIDSYDLLGPSSVVIQDIDCVQEFDHNMELYDFRSKTSVYNFQDLKNPIKDNPTTTNILIESGSVTTRTCI